MEKTGHWFFRLRAACNVSFSSIFRLRAACNISSSTSPFIISQLEMCIDPVYCEPANASSPYFPNTIKRQYLFPSCFAFLNGRSYSNSRCPIQLSNSFLIPHGYRSLHPKLACPDPCVKNMQYSIEIRHPKRKISTTEVRSYSNGFFSSPFKARRKTASRP